MNEMYRILRKERPAQIASVIFIAFTVFWVFLFFVERDSVYHATYGSTYGILAGWAGVVGIMISRKWGGYKSIVGRAIVFFSLGLLAQFLGQVAYTFYIYYLQIDIPYPSIGDIGYFGSIPLYIYAVVMLTRASGVKLSKLSLTNKMFAVFIPVLMLIMSYFLLLRGYEFDWSAPLAIFLDFGYPFGQAIYVSLAILTYMLSRSTLGGLMRGKVLFILFALLVQYLSDFSFIYLVRNDLWFVGGINDYIYLVSYFLMGIALIQLKTVSDGLKGEK